jgi:hypothetical protein
MLSPHYLLQRFEPVQSLSRRIAMNVSWGKVAYETAASFVSELFGTSVVNNERDGGCQPPERLDPSECSHGPRQRQIKKKNTP